MMLCEVSMKWPRRNLHLIAKSSLSGDVHAFASTTPIERLRREILAFMGWTSFSVSVFPSMKMSTRVSV